MAEGWAQVLCVCVLTVERWMELYGSEVQGGWAECTSSLCWIQSIYYLLFNNRQISLNQFIT